MRKFYKVSFEDDDWLRTQVGSVQQLFREASRANPFGDRWRPLETKLKRTAFHEAKRILEIQGIFKFRPIPSESDGRKNNGWEVLNLHGAATEYYQNGGNTNTRQTSYDEFLQSDYWQQVRKWVIERDSHTCQHCGATKRLQVHHLTYEHHGEEHLYPEDLVTLCRGCHEAVHGMNAD